MRRRHQRREALLTKGAVATPRDNTAKVSTGTMRHHEASVQYTAKVVDGVGRTEYFDLEVPLLTQELREGMTSRDPMAQKTLLRYVTDVASDRIMEHGPWACAMCREATASGLVTTPSLYRDRNLVVDMVPLPVCRAPACEQDACVCTQEILTKLHMETSRQETRGRDRRDGQQLYDSGADRISKSSGPPRSGGGSTSFRSRSRLYEGTASSIKPDHRSGGGVVASYLGASLGPSSCSAGGRQFLAVLLVFLLCYVTGVTVIGAARPMVLQ